MMLVHIAHVNVHVLQNENSQDTVRIHHISLLYIIIGRTICTMGILDHLGLLKVGSFSIHIPMAMPYDGASCTNTMDCGDQDTASIHDVSLPQVDIGRPQCIRGIP